MLPSVRNSVRGVFSALGSLLPRRDQSPPAGGPIVRRWRDDARRSYPSVGITAKRLLGFLQAADHGSPQMQFELFGEMLQRWPRLTAVEATRRLSLTGLAWEIVPDSSRGESPLAIEVAEYCEQTLREQPRLREVLDHLARAIAYGISVAELVWQRGRLTDIVPVPYSRLIADANEPWRLRVRTEDEPTWGVPIDAQPAKWIVHNPRPTPGRHFEGGLLRASGLLYLAQNLSFKDWLVFSQIAGIPVRVAKYEPGTPEADKQKLLKMLEALGTDAVAMFSNTIDLQFVQAHQGGEKPYEALQDYCNREITILWLGQNLTTEITAQGSRAAAEVHDRVREDLLVGDMADEALTLRRCLLAPLVRARFGADAPVPEFRRSLVQATDTRVLADTLAVAVNKLGLDVPRRWVHAALGIPAPTPRDEILPREGA